MSILIGGHTAPKAIYAGDRAVKAVYRGEDLVWKKSRLPDGYQEVEWIESSGTQYIDTGHFLTKYDNISIDFVYEGSISNVNNTGIFGSYEGNNRRYELLIFGNQKKYEFGYGSTYRRINSIDNARHKFDVIDGTYFVDEVQLDRFTSPEFTTGNCYIFAFSNGGTPMVGYALMSGKVYSFKIYNANLNIDMIPCYRKADGEIGLFDLGGSICPLTNTPFYINAGTGVFTKGPDVN